jgi:hypothetical protein
MGRAMIGADRERTSMKPAIALLALGLMATSAEAAGLADYYGRWSNGNCAEQWMTLAENKVTTFNKQFANIQPRPVELPAKMKLDGDKLSVESQEKGRTARREVFFVDGADALVLQDTFVDGRRMPSITRDQVVYKRCK